MKEKLFQNKLSVKKSFVHGYGVFAEEPIKRDDIVEECCVILTEGQDNVLKNFYFLAGDKQAIATGFGLLYNHAITPNVTYCFDPEYRLLTFRAKRDIDKGEELFISYGNDWFSSRALPVKELSFGRQLLKSLRPCLGIGLRALIAIGSCFLIIQLLSHAYSS